MPLCPTGDVMIGFAATYSQQTPHLEDGSQVVVAWELDLKGIEEADEARVHWVASTTRWTHGTNHLETGAVRIQLL